MTVKQAVLLAAAIIALLYLFFSCALWNLNPRECHLVARLFFVFLTSATITQIITETKRLTIMTPEELLRPRYKVIADYPGCIYAVGQNICESDNLEGATFFKKTVHKYPHLFHRLEWWEDRKPEEMPQYLKSPAGNSVRKVQSINHYRRTVVFENGKTRKIKQWLPATEAEYLTFKNSQP